MDKGDRVPEPDDGLLCGGLKNSESLCELDALLAHLPESKHCELADLICKFPCLFADIPSQTTWIEHDIDVGDAPPIKQPFYWVAPAKRSYLDAVVNYMLKNDIAAPSSSAWASPCILVLKQDGTPRFCTDFWKVNSVTTSDSIPLLRIDDCIDQVGSTKFVSKFDLLKVTGRSPSRSAHRKFLHLLHHQGFTPTGRCHLG